MRVCIHTHTHVRVYYYYVSGAKGEKFLSRDATTQQGKDKKKMSSELLHARTRSSERLEYNSNNGMSSSSPPTTTLSAPRANTPSTTSNNTTTSNNANNSTTTNKTNNGTTVNKMRKSASMLQFSEHAINQVQGLKNRGLDLPVTPRLQRRRYRCALEIVFLCLYLGNWKSERYPFEALFARIPRLDNRNTNDTLLLLLFTRDKTGEYSA